MAELQMLLDQEIPQGRNALLESHNNLKKVSSYCAQHYLEDPNKKTALEETKNFTTQSLASVAYQINTLASNMLHMLDIQAAQLANMDSAINNISQTVDIHKEKVARREIGLLTTNKIITRSHQIVAPTNPERPVKYVRKPVDYGELDDVGHGIKLSSQPSGGTVRRPSAASNKKSIDSGSNRDSIKSNVSAGYGTLRAVKAPTVPQEYNQSRRLPSMFTRTRTNSNSSSGSGSRSSSVGQISAAGGGGPPAPPSVPSAPSNVPPPPAISSVPPPPNMMPPPPMMSPQVGPPPPPTLPVSASTSPDSSGGYSTPNVAPDGRAPRVGGTAETYAATSVMDLPPPPDDYMGGHGPFQGRTPNLPTTGFPARIPDPGIPPPPPQMGGDMGLPPPPPSNIGLPPPMEPPISSDPDWAPHNYLEKMVVIYDYSADNADELNLREDDLVYVVKKNDDGWYEGVLNGVTGLFPGNYAESVST